MPFSLFLWFRVPLSGRSGGRAGGLLAVLIVVLLPILLLSGCEYIDSALPPTISPFPTLGRLPTVTPEPPRPTPSSTSTPRPPTPSPTPEPLTAKAVVNANVREGPGLDYTIITSVPREKDVILHGRSSTNWYQVTTPDGLKGWMAESVLLIEPEVATAVPDIEP